ncbi:hypothetical protein GBAR_LOCUS31235, partial [Geodia barretti]
MAGWVAPLVRAADSAVFASHQTCRSHLNPRLCLSMFHLFFVCV